MAIKSGTEFIGFELLYAFPDSSVTLQTKTQNPLRLAANLVISVPTRLGFGTTASVELETATSYVFLVTNEGSEALTCRVVARSSSPVLRCYQCKASMNTG